MTDDLLSAQNPRHKTTYAVQPQKVTSSGPIRKAVDSFKIRCCHEVDQEAGNQRSCFVKPYANYGSLRLYMLEISFVLNISSRVLIGLL